MLAQRWYTLRHLQIIYKQKGGSFTNYSTVKVCIDGLHILVGILTLPGHNLIGVTELGTLALQGARTVRLLIPVH